jgi:hypothetical protein
MRLNSGNACYHSVQNLLSSRLLSKKVKIRISKTLSLTLREEHRLRVFENRVLWRIFGPKRDESREGGENCITRSFMICILCQV